MKHNPITSLLYIIGGVFLLVAALLFFLWFIFALLGGTSGTAGPALAVKLSDAIVSMFNLSEENFSWFVFLAPLYAMYLGIPGAILLALGRLLDHVVGRQA